MQCILHPDRSASARCAGCAEALCPDCQVEVAGAAWCQKCKGSAVKRPPVIARRMTTSAQARNGVLVGLAGLVFWTPVCGTVAIVLGSKAFGEIASNPKMTGSGMALAAICLGCTDLLFFVFTIMSRA